MKYEIQIDSLNKIIDKILGVKNIETIFEIGARDGAETKAFNHFYPDAKIYSFECNPQTIPLWKKNTQNIKAITLTEKAVSDKDGITSFFPIDPEKTITDWKDGNPGASSLLRVSGKYDIEKQVQKEITVHTVKLSSFLKQNDIKHINFIWMDIQGAELMALHGLENRISDVDIIHTEVEFIEMYLGQPLFVDIHNYMKENGFLLGYFTAFGYYAGDAVFVNKKILKQKPFLFFYLSLKNKFAYPIHIVISKIKRPIGKILRFLKLRK